MGKKHIKNTLPIYKVYRTGPLFLALFLAHYRYYLALFLVLFDIRYGSAGQAYWIWEGHTTRLTDPKKVQTAIGQGAIAIQ